MKRLLDRFFFRLPPQAEAWGKMLPQLRCETQRETTDQNLGSARNEVRAKELVFRPRMDANTRE
jgi:hypothetical protein